MNPAERPSLPRVQLLAHGLGKPHVVKVVRKHGVKDGLINFELKGSGNAGVGPKPRYLVELPSGLRGPSAQVDALAPVRSDVRTKVGPRRNKRNRMT